MSPRRPSPTLLPPIRRAPALRPSRAVRATLAALATLLVAGAAAPPSPVSAQPADDLVPRGAVAAQAAERARGRLDAPAGDPGAPSGMAPRAATGDAAAAQEAPIEATSLLGEPLRRPALAAEARARMEGQLADAERALAASPGSAEAAVWVARRLGYLGRFRDALAVLDRAAAAHPDDPWVFRHRGHRYLTVRDFPRAAADLERAARLTRGRPDVVEPDGQPNARNQPIGTLQSNVWYHLALAHYFQGHWDAALRATTEGMRLATNADRLVSQLHWHYLTLRRLGRDDEARQALAAVRRDAAVIENDSYRRLVLLYRGELPPDSVLAPGAVPRAPDAVAMAYGLGAWHLAEGRREAAVEVFRRIVAGGNWPSFGYVAAEAELARLGGGQAPGGARGSGSASAGRGEGWVRRRSSSGASTSGVSGREKK